MITIDGSPLAADIEQLLVEAYVDDNRNLPDMFVLRFRDANRLVLSKAVAVKVARRAGLSIGSVEATSTVFDHVSQGGVSDWHFLSGLAQEIGYEVAVRDDKFEFCTPGRPPTDRPPIRWSWNWARTCCGSGRQ